MSTYLGRQYRAQELCESRGGLPGLSVPNKPDGLCGRKETLKREKFTKRKTITSADQCTLTVITE